MTTTSDERSASEILADLDERLAGVEQDLADHSAVLNVMQSQVEAVRTYLQVISGQHGRLANNVSVIRHDLGNVADRVVSNGSD